MKDHFSSAELGLFCLAVLGGACGPSPAASTAVRSRRQAPALSVGQLERLPTRGQAVLVRGIYWSAPRHCPPCPPRVRCKMCAPPLAKFTDSTNGIGTKQYSPVPWTFVRDEDRCRPLILGHRYLLRGTWTRNHNGSRYLHIESCRHLGPPRSSSG
jgi:hypothetical protein